MANEDKQTILSLLRWVNTFDREYDGFYHQMIIIMLRFYGLPTIAERIRNNFAKLSDCLFMLGLYAYSWDINAPNIEHTCIMFTLNAILNGSI